MGRLQAWWALRSQRERRRQTQGASPPVIGALDDLSGLLVEFRPEAGAMTFDGADILTWSSSAGSLTLTAFGDGDGNPVLRPDALGVGRAGVYFQGGKMTASVDWSLPDMTAVWAGNLDFPNMGDCLLPRWLSLWNEGVGGWDWNTPDGWVVGCYDSMTAMNGFVSDRNLGRPIDMVFDPARNYVFATRKQAGTITGWLRPIGEGVISASGATVNLPLVVDTLALGGNPEMEGGLHGSIAQVGLWGRALTETEVLAAMDYLSALNE